MTLPTTSPLNGNDDDSDMFGPPRSSPVGYHQRSRVPMISPKLRQREERKRILQLCAHKLERIKDSEANLRRSVCINNTYSRLTDEVRREKQSRYLANLPKSDNKPETAHDNMYSPYNHNYTDQMELRNESYKINHHSPHHHSLQESFNNNNSLHNMNSHHQKHKLSSIANNSLLSMPTTSSHNSASMLSSSSSSSSMGGSCAGGGGCDSGGTLHSPSSTSSSTSCIYSSPASHASSCSSAYSTSSQMSLTSSSLTATSTISSTSPISSTTITTPSSSSSSSLSSSSVDNDLEILDRELNAINASMPLIDPEITQGAEQLEKAVSSRKRSRTEEENDRLVREALSQFYLPTQRVISAIDDYPLDIKRAKLSPHCGLGSLGSLGHSSSIGDLDLDLGLDMTSHHHLGHHSHLHHHHHHLHHHHHHHQSQKEFEVIMDALRLSTSSPTPSAQDSCGQAAMMSESGVFHNLVVTSLET